MQFSLSINTGVGTYLKRAMGAIRSGDLSLGSLKGWAFGEVNTSGETVSRRTSMGVGAVYACVKVVSEGVAAAPFLLKENLQPGLRDAINRPEYTLIKNSPSPNVTAYTFWQVITADYLLEGNAYALIIRDGNGFAKELKYYPYSEVTPYINHINRTITYHINGITERIMPEDILHFKNLGFDGLTGESVIRLHAETIGNSLSASKMQGRQFKNGTSNGNGWYETPQGVNTEKAKETGDLINERYSGNNRFKSMVLPYGIKFHTVSVNQRDAQFIETMQYNTEDIAGIFNVPLHKIKRATSMAKANMEQQNIEFTTDTLHPITTNFSSELDLKLFGPDNQRYFTQADLSDLKKGDLQTMTDHYTKGIYSGIYSVNDVRQKMGLNPREGGDQYLQPTNTFNLDQLIVEMDKKKAETQKILDQAEALNN